MYASKDFKGSIQGLQGLIKASPDDARAPDALLVIAASQIELNDMAGAKVTLQKIVKDYPQANAAETAKSRLKLLQ
jgi:TolA-binding protein